MKTKVFSIWESESQDSDGPNSSLFGENEKFIFAVGFGEI